MDGPAIVKPALLTEVGLPDFTVMSGPFYTVLGEFWDQNLQDHYDAGDWVVEVDPLTFQFSKAYKKF